MPETLSSQKTGESPMSLDTTNWRIYKNETYGFEFRYPAEWSVEEEAGRFSIYYSPNSKINLGIENNDELLPVLEWLKKKIRTVGAETDKPFSVDGSSGIKRIYRASTGSIVAVSVIFPAKDKLNNLFYFETAGDENRRILDQILLSFRFLN